MRVGVAVDVDVRVAVRVGVAVVVRVGVKVRVDVGVDVFVGVRDGVVVGVGVRVGTDVRVVVGVGVRVGVRNGVGVAVELRVAVGAMSAAPTGATGGNAKAITTSASVVRTAARCNEVARLPVVTRGVYHDRQGEDGRRTCPVVRYRLPAVLR